MGKLYTSRYSNKDLIDSGAIMVGISLGKPRFPLKYEISDVLLKLAPNRAIFGITDKLVFRKRYTEQLDRIGADEVLKMLKSVGYGSDKDVVLLCYEDVTCDNPDKNWCHRTYLGNWIEEKLGIKVEEYPDKNCFAAKEARKNEQTLLDDSIEEQLKLF